MIITSTVKSRLPTGTDFALDFFGDGTIESAPLVITGSGNSWTAVSATSVPVARYFQKTVWTGSEMIVWGGLGASSFNDTFSYRPARALYLYQRL